MDNFEQELKMCFLDEVGQLLSDVEQCFLLLESNPQDVTTLEKLFRLAHNIKGSSKAVGFDTLGAFTHELESLLLKCRRGQIAITQSTISLLLKCNDHIKNFINRLKEDPLAIVNSDELINEIHNFKPDDTMPHENSSPLPSAEKKSISIDEVDLIKTTFTEDPTSTTQTDVNTKDEFVSETITNPIGEKNLSTTIAASPKNSSSQPQAAEESIRVSLSRLEKLLNFVGELVIFQTVLKEQAYSDNPQVLRKTIHQLGKVTKEVQDLSMSLRMVPLKQTFQKMQRIVRDTSSLLGKKVQLKLQGEETEVDKTVLEALGDPLVHLIRNAVDHGIEDPNERIAKGKPESGQVTLRAFHEGGKLVIEVKDNGGGISTEKLRRKAVENGILKPEQIISDREAIQLIFYSGFSTKAQVTEVSGRGVGMDVVKTNIEQMQGEILVDTVLNEGSVFKIILPLTLAIIDGMVVRCGEDRFVIPLAHVHESVKPESKDLKFATGIGEVLLLRGENLPVVCLSDALGKKKASKKPFSEQIAIIIRTKGKPFATLVDDVIGQHQVVIKKLGSEIQNLRGYSGSAILGDGKPALILELGDLMATPFRAYSPLQKEQVST